MNVLSVLVFIIIIIVKINGRNNKTVDRGEKNIKVNPVQVKPIQVNPVNMKSSESVSHESIQKRPVEVNNSKNATTMTDYLADKAKKEEMNKESEARKNQAKVMQLQKGMFIGERLMYGDSVPEGKTMVVCAYCRAENLVPHMVNGNYHCYFCREIL